MNRKTTRCSRKFGFSFAADSDKCGNTVQLFGPSEESSLVAAGEAIV